MKEGYRYGDLSMLIYERFQAKSWLARLFTAYYGSIHAWRRPISEALVPLQLAHRVGLETGDIEFAMISFSVLVWMQIFRNPLSQLNEQIAEMAEAMEFFGQKMALLIVQPSWQFIHNLMGLANKDPCTVTGAVFNEAKLEEFREWNLYSLAWIAYQKVILCFLFGRLEEGEQYISHCQYLLKLPFGAEDMIDMLFFSTMTLIVCAQSSRHASRRRRFRIRRLIRLVRRYAHVSPFNYLSRVFLLEAEFLVLQGKPKRALSKYVSAIAHTKEEGYLLHTALAYERLGKYHAKLGDETNARFYIEKALFHYKTYGAEEKYKHLNKEMKMEMKAGVALLS